jgi:hypothetical protein
MLHYFAVFVVIILKLKLKVNRNEPPKIFKFKEKIPALSARLSALITFSKFLKALHFFTCQEAYCIGKTFKKISWDRAPAKNN